MTTTAPPRGAQRVLKAAGDYAHAVEWATEKRNRAIVRAREQGCTWRMIALATGLTEPGVKKIYERTK